MPLAFVELWTSISPPLLTTVIAVGAPDHEVGVPFVPPSMLPAANDDPAVRLHRRIGPRDIVRGAAIPVAPPDHHRTSPAPDFDRPPRRRSNCEIGCRPRRRRGRAIAVPKPPPRLCRTASCGQASSDPGAEPYITVTEPTSVLRIARIMRSADREVLETSWSTVARPTVHHRTPHLGLTR